MDLPNELSFKEKRALVEALLACKCMETSQSRDQIIADLDPALKNRIDRKPNNQQDVDSLVRTCLQYPPGMDDLLEIVAYQESNSIPWQKLNLVRYEICIRSTYQTITPTLLEELKRLLKAPLATDLIGKCFSQSYSDPFLSPEPAPKDTFEAFLRLFDEGVLNALGFLERIADHLKSSENAKALRHWAAAVARNLNLTADFEQQREQMIARQTAPVFLLIQLLPAFTQAESFTVQAWGWKAEEDCQSLEPRDTPCNFPAVKEEVRKLIKEVEEKFGSTNIVVELIMPRHLFCKDLTDWKIDVGEMESSASLLDTYPVVLRWLNRFLNRQKHTRWREKWQALLDSQNGKGKVKLEWLACADVCTVENLFKSFRQTHCGAYLALGFVPHEQPKEDLLTASLNAGTSIAVWFRYLQEDELVTQSIVEDLLANIVPPDLPRHVQELRGKHQEDRFHLAHRLTLLYDDYHRVPDLLPTQAPTQV